MKDRVMQVILAEAGVEKGFIPDHAKNKFSDNSGNLKCPFCGQELEIVFKQAGYNLEEAYLLCNKCNLRAERKLWQELIHTRKALDVAVDELTKIKVAAESVGIGFFMTAAIFALAKIKTALEQKDVK